METEGLHVERVGCILRAGHALENEGEQFWPFSPEQELPSNLGDAGAHDTLDRRLGLVDEDSQELSLHSGLEGGREFADERSVPDRELLSEDDCCESSHLHTSRTHSWFPRV